MTQQNAAMVEESTAAGHSLRSEADNLMTLVSRFEIDAIGRRI
jgi:methyl-accepting chemotaxis protein